MRGSEKVDTHSFLRSVVHRETPSEKAWGLAHLGALPNPHLQQEAEAGPSFLRVSRQVPKCHARIVRQVNRIDPFLFHFENRAAPGCWFYISGCDSAFGELLPRPGCRRGGLL